MSETNQPYAGETCSASRHVLAIAGDLARDGHCQHIVDEPKHCAESMLATVEALWAARNAARATAADHVGDANKMVPGGWPCEIIEADFEHNTVTLKMNHYGYIVGAGPHYLVPADAAPQPVSEDTVSDAAQKLGHKMRAMTGRTDKCEYCGAMVGDSHNWPGRTGGRVWEPCKCAPQPAVDVCRVDQPEGWRCTRANGHKGPCAAVEDRA